MCSPLSHELRQLVDRNPSVANLYKNALRYLSDSDSSDSEGLEETLCHTPGPLSTSGSSLGTCRQNSTYRTETKVEDGAQETKVPTTPVCVPLSDGSQTMETDSQGPVTDGIRAEASLSVSNIVPSPSASAQHESGWGDKDMLNSPVQTPCCLQSADEAPQSDEQVRGEARTRVEVAAQLHTDVGLNTSSKDDTHQDAGTDGDWVYRQQGDVSGDAHEAVQEVLMSMAQHLPSLQGGSTAMFVQGAAASMFHSGPATSCADSTPTVTGDAQNCVEAVSSAVVLQSTTPSWEDYPQVKPHFSWTSNRVEQQPTISVHHNIAAELSTADSDEMHGGFLHPSKSEVVQEAATYKKVKLSDPEAVHNESDLASKHGLQTAGTTSAAKSIGYSTAPFMQQTWLSSSDAAVAPPCILEQLHAAQNYTANTEGTCESVALDCDAPFSVQTLASTDDYVGTTSQRLPQHVPVTDVLHWMDPVQETASSRLNSESQYAATTPVCMGVAALDVASSCTASAPTPVAHLTAVAADDLRATIENTVAEPRATSAYELTSASSKQCRPEDVPIDYVSNLAEQQHDLQSNSGDNFATTADCSLTIAPPIAVMAPQIVGWAFEKYADTSCVDMPPDNLPAKLCDVYIEGAGAFAPIASDCCVLPPSMADHAGPYSRTSDAVDWFPSLPPDVSRPPADLCQCANESTSNDFAFTAGGSSPAEAGSEDTHHSQGHLPLSTAEAPCVSVPSAHYTSCDVNSLDTCWKSSDVNCMQEAPPAACELRSYDVQNSAHGRLDGSAQSALEGNGYAMHSIPSTCVWKRIASVESVAWTKSDQAASCEGSSQQTWPASSGDDTPASSTANMNVSLPLPSDEAVNSSPIVHLSQSSDQHCGGDTEAGPTAIVKHEIPEHNSGSFESTAPVQMKSWETAPGVSAVSLGACSGGVVHSDSSLSTDAPESQHSCAQDLCSQPQLLPQLCSSLEKAEAGHMPSLQMTGSSTHNSPVDAPKVTTKIRPLRGQEGPFGARPAECTIQHNMHELVQPLHEEGPEVTREVHNSKPHGHSGHQQPFLFITTLLKMVAEWSCWSSVGNSSNEAEDRTTEAPSTNEQPFSLASNSLLSPQTVSAIRERQDRFPVRRKSRPSAGPTTLRSASTEPKNRSSSVKAKPSIQGATSSPAAARLVAQAQQLLEAAQDDQDDDVMRAFTLLTEAAKLKETKAMLHLAHCYLLGKGSQRSLSSAMFWLDQAASKGDPSGLYLSGVAHESGSLASAGMQHSEEQASDCYKRATRAGHSVAMVALGSLRERASRAEDGTIVNLKCWREAQHWYHEAAAYGNKDALEALGLLYQTDDAPYRGQEAVDLLIRSSSDPQLSTVPESRSLEQELAILLTSENAGRPESRHSLDSIRQHELKEVDHCEQPRVAFCAHDNELFCDGREAASSRLLSAYRSASVQTDATMLWTELPKPIERRRTGRSRGSARSTAGTSEHRLIVSQSRASSSSDDEAACSYTCAQHLVLKGDALYFGHGFKANPAAAVKLYAQATQLYHAPAMVRLSECYNNGVGVVKDLQKGMHWLMEAAEANHPIALCRLAEHHCSGNEALGIPQDLNRAEQLLRSAVDEDNSNAMVQLARLYANGSGVLASGRLLKAAAKQGNTDAQTELGFLYYHGTGMRQDRQLGMQMLAAAARAGDAQAICGLGLCHLEGHAVSMNVSVAIEHLKCAADMGHTRALLHLGRARLKLCDHRLALESFRHAAYQGVAEAHWHIAVMLENGLGGPKDLDGARRHYSLAKSQRYHVKGETEHLRDALAGNSTALSAEHSQNSAQLAAVRSPRTHEGMAASLVRRRGSFVESTMPRTSKMTRGVNQRKSLEKPPVSPLHQASTAPRSCAQSFSPMQNVSCTQALRAPGANVLRRPPTKSESTLSTKSPPTFQKR